MATFIRGKSGIVEELNKEANKLANRLRASSRMTQKQRARLQGEHDALATFAAWLQLSDVHVLTEEQFDNRFKIGGYDPATAAPDLNAFAVTEQPAMTH